ncbi:hypothetical protein [Mycobacterium sp. Aquia_213]|uniref:hypothetical protein n=1 Tax=Mycobacterium sp. Aquia_213 TaxID=2991728 RepID=UPI002272260B|nr:hypothetical protein [Mycobacterium sp. Aquia_213]WAC93971.1 hypothetical protein LMQ14_13095 [Mycobacterium sp. Aquia_213]
MGGVPTAAKLAAASLMVAGWAASTVVANANPDDTPGPAPGQSASPSPAASPAPAASPSASPAPPAGAPKTVMDKDGLYAVGTDIVPGIYSSGGPIGNGTCYWKRTSNPDGALIDNSLTKKPQVVKIEPTDKAFKTDGCQPWQLTPDAAAPADVPGPVAGAQLQGTLGTLNGLLGPNGMRVPGT